ncbi:MAG: aldo/keto reductase [Myxococcota bacterium]
MTTPPDSLYTPRQGGPAPLVLGCMNFGKRTPEPEARRIIDLAIARGVTLFDTANAYVDGESERILGRALRGRRDAVAVATKVGSWKREGLAPERVRAALDASLGRLGMDHVDLYYLHVPDPATPIEATLEAVRDVIASGKARRFGISNYASWQALEILQLCDRMGMPRPVVSQQLYNLLIRQLDLEYLRFAAKYALHTTVYNPLAGGLLSGRHDAARTTLAGSRFDKNGMYQRRYLSDVFFEAVTELGALARDAGMTLVTMAYAWLARRPGVDSILAGPGSVAHLEDALAAVEVVLDDELLAKIDAVHRALVGTDASYAR